LASTVRVKEAITVKHQANLGEEVAEVELSAGEEVTVLKEWKRHYLVKNSDGKLFNLEKSQVSG
jgi:hypothetical protein